MQTNRYCIIVGTVNLHVLTLIPPSATHRDVRASRLWVLEHPNLKPGGVEHPQLHARNKNCVEGYSKCIGIVSAKNKKNNYRDILRVCLSRPVFSLGGV